MSKLTLDPARSALLVMDFQTPIVERYADGQETLLATTADVIDAARQNGVRVIYVVVGFRDGFRRSVPTTRPSAASGNPAASPPTSIHGWLAPAAGEVIVTKHRVGAFTGTDLEMILRANAPRRW